MSNIEIIKEKISKDRLNELARAVFGDMAKVVVDVERSIMAAGGEMHADCEQVLLDDGSKQEHLWGANIYPDEPIDSRIEYDSLINIRPRDNNRTMRVEDEEIKKKIKNIIDFFIE